MTEVLGCRGPLENYTIGRSLFSRGERPFLISGSYADYAVVTKQRITRIYPGGDYVINYPNGHHMYGAHLDKDSLEQAFEDVQKYFQY